jgi:miniconductance mechanosensitive channel
MDMKHTFSLQERFASWVMELVIKAGVSNESALVVKLLILLSTLILLIVLIDWISRKLILAMVKQYASKRNNKFMDILVEKKIFKYLGHIIPAIFAKYTMPLVLFEFQKFLPFAQGIFEIIMVVVIVLFLQSVLKVLKVILLEIDSLKDKPIASFTQLIGMIINILALLVLVSIISGKPLWALFTAVGAMSAVLALAFKNVLLGFAASVQISTNDLLRNGDWVEFSKYGADGIVTDINLSTVKIKNWDNTDTTIPTMAFTTESFKNWRGMEESGGRRIKRAVFVKISSIRFCTDKMLEKYKKINLIKSYIEEKQPEIEAFNESMGFDKSIKGNGRHLTNLGLFRIYLKAYIESVSSVNREMEHLVRQLAPTDKGLPIEIYCFAKEKKWVGFEDTQADIFDHVFSAVRDFDLEMFESPSSDFHGELESDSLI